MKSIFDTKLPIAFAHRGGNERYPENTLAAFQDAYELGYKYFETDVHYTLGHELVAFHDDNLERTLGFKGKVADMTKSDRKHLLIEGHYPVPLLEELLQAFPDVYFNIDAKSPAAVEPLVKMIKNLKCEKRICLASFKSNRVRHLRQLLPGVLTTTSQSEVAHLRYGLPGIKLPAVETHYLNIPRHVFYNHGLVPLVSKAALKKLHAKGCKVFVWTINEKHDMERLLAMEVDGIFTDKLRVLKEVLMAHHQWH